MDFRIELMTTSSRDDRAALSQSDDAQLCVVAIVRKHMRRNGKRDEKARAKDRSA